MEIKNQTTYKEGLVSIWMEQSGFDKVETIEDYKVFLESRKDIASRMRSVLTPEEFAQVAPMDFSISDKGSNKYLENCTAVLYPEEKPVAMIPVGVGLHRVYSPGSDYYLPWNDSQNKINERINKFIIDKQRENIRNEVLKGEKWVIPLYARDLMMDLASNAVLSSTRKFSKERYANLRKDFLYGRDCDL